MMGYISKQLDAQERQELGDAIKDYARGLTPLIVPVTLIRHNVSKYRVAYLASRRSPKELMLRNHV